MVLASLLTFGNQILVLKSFLEAEWKTGRGFGGVFLCFSSERTLSLTSGV